MEKKQIPFIFAVFVLVFVAASLVADLLTPREFSFDQTISGGISGETASQKVFCCSYNAVGDHACFEVNSCSDYGYIYLGGPFTRSDCLDFCK